MQRREHLTDQALAVPRALPGLIEDMVLHDEVVERDDRGALEAGELRCDRRLPPPAAPVDGDEQRTPCRSEAGERRDQAREIDHRAHGPTLSPCGVQTDRMPI